MGDCKFSIGDDEMKKQYIHIIIFSALTIFFSGCFGLGGYLTGMEAMDAKTFNEYQKNIKPELYYWNKYGIGNEQKTKDWIECCGKADGTFPGCKLEKKDGETSLNPAWHRLNDKKNSCMTNKGYKYGSQYITQ